MLLPNAARAFVDIRKLSEYSLDPTHPVRRNKAIVFRSALGLTADDADMLRDLLLGAVLDHDAALGRLDEFGQRYVVDFPASTFVGSVILRSAWMVRHHEDFPRLTTCFVLPD